MAANSASASSSSPPPPCSLRSLVLPSPSTSRRDMWASEENTRDDSRRRPFSSVWYTCSTRRWRSTWTSNHTPGMDDVEPAGMSARNMDGDVHMRMCPSTGASPLPSGGSSPLASCASSDDVVHMTGTSSRPATLRSTCGSSTVDTQPAMACPARYLASYVTPFQCTAPSRNSGTLLYMWFSRASDATHTASRLPASRPASPPVFAAASMGLDLWQPRHRVALLLLRRVQNWQNHGTSSPEKAVPQMLQRVEPARFTTVHAGHGQSMSAATLAARARLRRRLSSVDTERHAMSS